MRLDLPVEQFVLNNGLRVFVHERRTVPLVAVNIWYHVGSSNEQPGRTGLAHLFEHLMFEGSEHVPPGTFDRLIEQAGGSNNGSTSTDRTNYWINVPSNALELALHLESDRMGWLLPALTRERMEAQRSVVMNERRQSYENRPYGLAHETINAALYPEDHPYHWPVIGWMPDLEAATFEDVTSFFSAHYRPDNATLAIAGDVEVGRVRELVESYFGEIPVRRFDDSKVEPVGMIGAAAGRAVQVQQPSDNGDATRPLILEDDVHLPRSYMAWRTPPTFEIDEAELDLTAHALAAGRASRLYRSLVYERRVAQRVDAYQDSGRLGSTFFVVLTAKPGAALDDLERAARDEIAAIAGGGLGEDELESARSVFATAFVSGLRTVGGFGGRADLMNMYAFLTGDPASLDADWQRYQRVTTERASQAVKRHLHERAPMIVRVLPRSRS